MPPELKSPPDLSYDVVVVGGGVAGSVAAIAAARAGVRVLLVEEHGFLGGSLTAMGVGPMMSFHNPAGQQVVQGIPDEIISRLQARGASLGHIPDTTTYCSTVTPFDSEELKIELETMLQEAGGEVLYHTQLASVETRDGTITRVVVCNKAGLTALRARVFVDATGDGDLAARAGVTFTYGRDGDAGTQPMTMNLKVGNVDTAAIRRYARENPDDFLWHPVGQEEALRRLETAPRISLAGFLQAWRAARERGEVDVPRDQVLFFETPTPGVVIVNTSRVVGLDPTEPFQLSRAESIRRARIPAHPRAPHPHRRGDPLGPGLHGHDRARRLPDRRAFPHGRHDRNPASAAGHRLPYPAALPPCGGAVQPDRRRPLHQRHPRGGGGLPGVAHRDGHRPGRRCGRRRGGSRGRTTCAGTVCHDSPATAGTGSLSPMTRGPGARGEHRPPGPDS